MWFGARWPGSNPGSATCGCVALMDSHLISVLQFDHLENSDNSAYLSHRIVIRPQGHSVSKTGSEVPHTKLFLKSHSHFYCAGVLVIG